VNSSAEVKSFVQGKSPEAGQSLIMTALVLAGVLSFAFLLVINVPMWFSTVDATRRAAIIAARDGATMTAEIPLLTVNETLILTTTSHLASARHCLDQEQAVQATLGSLRRNLETVDLLYVHPETEAKIGAADIITGTDEAGYSYDPAIVREIYAVNPNPACPGQPVNPAAFAYPNPESDYTAMRCPYVHLVLDLPMRAMFGGYVVRPDYRIDVSAAIDAGGGKICD
jgi:hypothetical protein